MIFESSLPIIKAFVMANPFSTAEQIQKGTGLHISTVNRQLTGGYKNATPNVFVRVKKTRKVDHGNGNIRGSYKWHYSINDGSLSFTKKAPIMKNKLSQHPLIMALYGIA